MYRIFDQNTSKSFPKAAVEHVIQITFKDETPLGLGTQNTYGTLIGYLNNEFEYSAKGNYTDVFNVTKINSQLLKLFEDSIQRNIGNYGLLTKKMYTNGESPILTVNFRCWAANSEYAPSYAGSQINDKNDRIKNDAISNPVIVANALINATMPRVDSKSILMTKDVPTAIGEVFTLLPGAELLSTGLRGESFGQGLKNVVSGASNLADRLVNILSKKPPVCTVKIGNIFEKDMMVVASVEVKFSKEYHEPGVPLYGDYNVTLQSLYTGSVNDAMGNSNSGSDKVFGSGLNSKRSTRVTFDDQSVTVDSLQKLVGDKFQQFVNGGNQ